ncbi:MAG: helix-turn-helix transcriptional regulator [Clostridia bacterium]|nr:helix-turn-helix transcriptional regulator [Clostridia bacterium]
MRNEIVMPSVPNSSIHISGTGRKAKKDAFCDIHVHSEFELLKILEGHTEFYVYDKEHRVECGDIIFVNSRVPHSTAIHKDSAAFFIQFHTDIQPDDNEVRMSKYLSRFINIANEDAVVFKAGTELNSAISICLDSIRSEYIQKDNSYDIFIKGYIYTILALLYRNKVIIHPESFFESGSVSKILPVLEYIDANYSKQITLPQLSEIINVNEFYFCRLFKRVVNTPVMQYLNFVRVCKAEKLLLSTDKSVSEIAFETGFSSVSYFNRIFKKYKYCTPKMYKKIKYEPGR